MYGEVYAQTYVQHGACDISILYPTGVQVQHRQSSVKSKDKLA
jgi:hypothetical protein